MPRRNHGLIGPGKGPRLRVNEATRSLAEIRGLKKGRVFTRVYNEEGELIDDYVFIENGDFIIANGAWVEFEFDGEEIVVCSIKVI